MSVEKYLENVKVPQVKPGPFSVRLKYNLKNYCYEQRRKRDFFLTITSKLAFVLFIFVAVMIYKPELAANLHDNLLSKTGIIDNMDEEQMLAEKRQAEIELPNRGRYLGMMHNVSTSGSSDNNPYRFMELSDLAEEKPYMIRKVRDRNNRYIYIINELDASEEVQNSLY